MHWWDRLKAIGRQKRYKSVLDVFVFVVLLFASHYLYIWWNNTGFAPIGEQVRQFFNWGSRVLYNQSAFVINLLGIDYVTEGQTFYITARDGQQTWLEVAPGCTSLKQWSHWIFIMALFPGPWKHKLWYIPTGILVIQLISIVRISGLAVVLRMWPDSFDFAHDYIFKTLFYGVIFLMWVLWVEFFRCKTPSKDTATAKTT